ncbi:hypothetical protein BJV78DRAFT_1364190 [Lactifluus subvellereus]|nr:hypothetical protein BJV78DRAFT_1364190 [Lactifluus subvellereus]
MSDSPLDTYPRPTARQHEPYQDSPAMTSPRRMNLNDTEPRLPSFRSSAGLFTTPEGVSKQRPSYEPMTLRFWIVCLGCVMLAAVGIGLEIALEICTNNQGFPLPRHTAFNPVRTIFLISYFPSMLFLSLALMIRSFDWSVRLWNPYLILSRGNARADETLLVDYVEPSRPFITLNALKFKHNFIFISGITALVATQLQPLAGCIISMRLLPVPFDSSVKTTNVMGLAPDIADLTMFSASAGFAVAAVANGLPDPPFINSSWVTAEFSFDQYIDLNGTVSVNTTAILTDTRCAVPNLLSFTPSNAGKLTVSATSTEGCSLEVAVDPTDAAQQYGVVNVPNCGANTTNPALQPVFFWFWQQNPSQLAGVFCQPIMHLYDVAATAYTSNKTLANVTVIRNYQGTNNVTGAPLNGVPYNGLIFEGSTDINVQSRANSIRTGIPNAIWMWAQKTPGGPDSVFRDPNGFVSYTTRTYTRYLSMAAKSNYFVEANQSVPAVVTQLVMRIFIPRIPCHILSSICILTAATLLVLHFMHRRQRRNIRLAHNPGTICSAVALTWRSDFGELLMPYENEEQFSRRLASHRFRLDSSGAIVVDRSAMAETGEVSRPAFRDETRMGLVEKGQQQSGGDDT